jgi:hypothetical protein
MWFLFALRAAGILLGAFSLLLLATQTGEVQYKQWFADWLRYLEGWVFNVPLDFIKKLFIDNIFAIIESFGWQLPELNDVWRHVFMLNWLIMAAFARNAGSIALWVFGFIVALYGALIAGLSGNVLAGFSATAVAVAIGTSATRAALTFGFTVGAVIVAGFAIASATIPIWVVGALAAFISAWLLVGGIRHNWSGGLRAVLNDFGFNIGLDVLFAMGIAFFFVAYMAEPPLW